MLYILADGMTFEEVLEEYPSIAIENIRASIAHGAEISKERFV